MSYSTPMVHLELDRPNAGLLAMAGDLAGRLHSRVIGVATAQPIVFSYSDGYIAAREDRRRLRAWFDGSLPISTAGRGSVARPAHGIKAEFIALPAGGDENVTLASVIEES